MPLQKLQFRPGINREGTNYSNEGGWYDCDKVRFRSGFPQKIGGWVRATPGYTYDGVCRMMINWVDLSNNNLLGIGTHLKYYVNNGLTAYRNITPIRRERSPTTVPPSALNNPFACTSGSTTVVVTDAANGAQVGDYVTFSNATTFGGIPASEINTEHKITNVLGSNTYEIKVTTAATSTVASGGGASVNAYYQLNIGLPAYTIGNGFGAGIWNGANVSVNTTLAYTAPYVSGLILLDNIATTINVTSTTGFAASGTILIDSEIITYTGITATSFTGCTRGTSQSMAAFHSLDPTVGSAVPPPIPVYQVTNLLGTTGWGNASTIAFGSGIGQQMRLWSNDTYGQDLLINPRGGKIYYWTDNTATFPPATELSTDVPIVATNQIVISDVSRFGIAMGCNPFNSGTFDPLLVRWSHQENLYVWDPDATTPTGESQAGETRLTNGSYIMTSRKTRQEILIWTDAAIYSMQFVGPPYVFGFTLLMDNLSIMSPGSATVVNNVAYWMGTDKFYIYTGRVETLPCSIRQYIFTDLNFDQRFQVFSASNEGYNEIWWFYVSNTEVAAAAQESRIPTIDKYVMYNHLERLWTYGSLRRTFWLDTPLQNVPLAAQGILVGATNSDANHTSINNGTLLFQESGVDDASTATPVPFNTFIQSSDFDIDDGHNFGFVWRIIPDITFAGSGGNENNVYPSVTMEVRPRTFSGAPYGPTITDTVTSAQPYGPVKQYTIEEYTQQVYTRIRGRQIAFKISSGGQLGVTWQLGSPRIDIRKDGRR